MTSLASGGLLSPAKQLALLACVLALTAIAGLTFGEASSSAYEGPFCAGVPQPEFTGCESVERSSIRRAIGHTTDGYVYLEIITNIGGRYGYCYNYLECEGDTGYLSSDGHGHGYIWNEGPNGTQDVHGYLYP